MKNLILSVILLMAISLKAQKGKDFPSIIGLTLEGKAMHLPMKNGKRTVVAVVFSRSAEDDLKKWAAPLYEAFADRQTSELGMTAPEQVNFFFIPFIGGMKKMVEEFKKTTDKALWPYVMDTDKMDMKLQAKLLGISDLNSPYVMLLDKDGKVQEFQSGPFKQDKLEKIEDLLD